MPALSNPKHERFASELAKGKTAEEAYKIAGYKPSIKNAHRLKANEGIRARVDEILNRAAKKVSATIERTLEELVKIAYVDIGDAVKWDGSKVVLDDSRSLPPFIRAAISEVRQTKVGVTIKFHSKTQALEMLGRTLGMFKDKLEIEGSLDIAERILARRREIRKPTSEP